MNQPRDATAAKNELRAGAHTRRDALTAAYREAASAVIAERAIAIAGRKPARVLAAYLPIWSEVDPRAIIAWAFEKDIAVVLPAIVDETHMAFRRYRPGDPLVDGGFGTLAPGPETGVADPDVMISPMMAFDRSGTRLGHGLGHYDRGIARLFAKGQKPLLIGVAFAAQEAPAIPAEPHDVRMDWIVTENETFDFRRMK